MMNTATPIMYDNIFYLNMEIISNLIKFIEIVLHWSLSVSILKGLSKAEDLIIIQRKIKAWHLKGLKKLLTDILSNIDINSQRVKSIGFIKT